MHTYPAPYAPHSKMPVGTIYLPNPPPPNSTTDKIYETQMLELPISDEDMTMKSVSRNNTSHHDQRTLGMPYRNSYGNSAPSAYEGDFSIEENMYAINIPGRIDPVTNRPSYEYPPQQYEYKRW